MTEDDKNKLLVSGVDLDQPSELGDKSWVKQIGFQVIPGLNCPESFAFVW
jgi:hypothetical protein